MSKLPPWEAHNDRERKAMADWVNSELNRISVEKQNRYFLREDGTFDVAKYFSRRAEYYREINAAEHGNIVPLRARLGLIDQRIAKFVNLPTRRQGKRGKRWPRERQDANLRRAVLDDVKHIRQLWQKHYRKKNRHADDGPSAEEIAAARWGVEVRDVVRWLKKSRAK